MFSSPEQEEEQEEVRGRARVKVGPRSLPVDVPLLHLLRRGERRDNATASTLPLLFRQSGEI